MADLNAVKAVYQQYFEELAQAREKLTGFQFFFGGGVGNDPCQERFAQALEGVMGELAASADGETARAVLEYVYRAPQEHRDDKSAYWMLMAVHGLTVPAVKALTPADAADLAAWYDKAYPKRKRFPTQNETVEALKTQAKQD